jgi:hypothetical protein
MFILSILGYVTNFRIGSDILDLRVYMILYVCETQSECTCNTYGRCENAYKIIRKPEKKIISEIYG